MSKIKHISKYTAVIVMVLIIAIISAGCRKDDGTELELKEVAIQDEDVNQKTESDDDSEKESQDSEKKEAEKVEPQELYVHVCGHVKQPGVYKLQSNSRVYEAIEAAGGMTDTAAFSYLNQAGRLQDGQQIYVPSQEEAESGKVPAETEGTDTLLNPDESKIKNQGTSEDIKVNLNTASKEELMTLNGIGDVRAQAILKYREEHGEFHSIEELMEVEGIKKGTFQKLKDQIKI